MCENISGHKPVSMASSFHRYIPLYNAEVVSAVPSGAGAQSAPSHLFIPYKASEIRLSEVPQLKTSDFLHPLSR